MVFQNGKKEVKLFTTDWSGVMSDDRMPVYESNMRVLEAHGIKRMTFQQWLPVTQLTPIEFFANHGLIGDRDKLFQEYSDVFSVVRREGMNPTVYPDAAMLLKFLAEQDIPTIVISSHPSGHVNAEALEYGLSGYFAWFKGDVKDKTVGILEVCQKEGFSPSNTLYVGDTIYDVQAAKKAEAISVGISSGYHIRSRLEAETPDFVVDTLTELKSVVAPLLRQSAVG